MHKGSIAGEALFPVWSLLSQLVAVTSWGTHWNAAAQAHGGGGGA